MTAPDEQIDASSPVRQLAIDPPPDQIDRQLVDRIGLCLSGGGYRAMLFHLGALWRLNEAGILRYTARISSVSGGSITAGVLGVSCRRLMFDERDVAKNFCEVVVDPDTVEVRT